jgi:hypothetical protein
MAWSTENTRYLFWKKNDYNDWARIEDDTVFRPRTLPQGILIGEINVDNHLLKPGEQLALSSSAFAPPFRIRMSYASTSTTVIGKSDGEVIVQPDDMSAETSTRAAQ